MEVRLALRDTRGLFAGGGLADAFPAIRAQPRGGRMLEDGEGEDGGGCCFQPGRALKYGRETVKWLLGSKMTEKREKKGIKLVDISSPEGNLGLLEHFNPELL